MFRLAEVDANPEGGGIRRTADTPPGGTDQTDKKGKKTLKRCLCAQERCTYIQWGGGAKKERRRGFFWGAQKSDPTVPERESPCVGTVRARSAPATQQDERKRKKVPFSSSCSKTNSENRIVCCARNYRRILFVSSKDSRGFLFHPQRI